MVRGERAAREARRLRARWGACARGGALAREVGRLRARRGACARGGALAREVGRLRATTKTGGRRVALWRPKVGASPHGLRPCLAVCAAPSLALSGLAAPPDTKRPLRATRNRPPCGRREKGRERVLLGARAGRPLTHSPTPSRLQKLHFCPIDDHPLHLLKYSPISANMEGILLMRGSCPRVSGGEKSSPLSFTSLCA